MWLFDVFISYNNTLINSFISVFLLVLCYLWLIHPPVSQITKCYSMFSYICLIFSRVLCYPPRINPSLHMKRLLLKTCMSSISLTGTVCLVEMECALNLLVCVCRNQSTTQSENPGPHVSKAFLYCWVTFLIPHLNFCLCWLGLREAPVQCCAYLSPYLKKNEKVQFKRSSELHVSHGATKKEKYIFKIY